MRGRERDLDDSACDSGVLSKARDLETKREDEETDSQYQRDAGGIKREYEMKGMDALFLVL